MTDLYTIQGELLYLACSRRSDSGKGCEVKSFTPHRSPLSERLEQAILYYILQRKHYVRIDGRHRYNYFLRPFLN